MFVSPTSDRLPTYQGTHETHTYPPPHSPPLDYFHRELCHTVPLSRLVGDEPEKSRSILEPSKASSVWGSSTDGMPSAAPRATVRYVLRAEDIATGREWLVFPRYSDFRWVGARTRIFSCFFFIIVCRHFSMIWCCVLFFFRLDGWIRGLIFLHLGFGFV